MSRIWWQRHRATAWLLGCIVLVGVGVALVGLFRRPPVPGVASPAPAAAGSAASATADPSASAVSAAPPSAPPSAPGRLRRVAGVVRLPEGLPAAGATVVAYRAITAWPEWRKERIDQAITGGDGSFEFRVDPDLDLLVGFEHPQWAGGLEDVPSLRKQLNLQLQPGFPLAGIVTNDVGAPLASVRVAAESVLADQRRATWVDTAPNGRFEFTNLPAGPVRLVARHPLWQPAVQPAVVIGATQRVELAFDRPALPPLRGRVVSAIGQTPIGGATVELLPPNGKLGLVDPFSAMTAADGTFELRGLARGTVQVLVRHPEHGAVMPTLAIGMSSASPTFELPPRSAFSGQLTLGGQVQPDWAGLHLLVRDLSGELAVATVDEAGRFEFARRLSPGSAALRLLGGALSFQRSAAAETTVRIDESARTALELPLMVASRGRGRVVDEQGRGLPGVLVQQTKQLAESARWISDAASAFDVGAFGSQVAQLVSYDRDVLLAVSAEDGTFEFRGQKPGPLLARFDLPGRGSRWLRIVVPEADGAVAEFGDVVMPPACRIAGRVERGGVPLAGAAVTVVGGESQAMVVTRGDGSFVVEDLQPGDYRVRARLPSMPTANAETDVRVQPGSSTLSGPIVLPAGRTVRGVVLGSDGQPVPGALVTVSGAGGQPTITDPGGRFVLELPNNRSVVLQASLGDRSRSRVPVRLGQQEVEIRLATSPSCTLVAQVFGLPGRRRPPGALLRVSVVEGGLETVVRTRWVEMQGGELRWPFCPVGRVRVQICCEGFAPWSAERDLVANEEQSLGEVLLEPGCKLVGRVVDPAGAPVGNASVLLGDEADLDLFEPAVRSGADGVFRIGGVTTRSTSLVVRAPGLAPRTIDLQLPFDVLSPQPLVVQLEPGSTIEVEVGGRAREGGLVQLRRQGRVLATAEIDGSGRAEFVNRSPGLYTVQLYGSDEVQRPVRLSGTGQRMRVRL
jgi:hypothetical protein